mgnify:CR=1 FL=1|jgi:hypothetical protein
MERNNRSGFDFPGIGKTKKSHSVETAISAVNSGKIGNNTELTPELIERASKKVVENLYKKNLELLKD